MAYCTAAELRAQINKASALKDVEITALIAGAELTINNFCNRPDGFEADAAASARVYAGSGKPWQRIDECVEITLVAVKESATDTTYTSWAVTDWIAFNGDYESPDFNNLPYAGIMVDPSGDESIFYSGAYRTRGGFRPSTEYVRGVPTVQVTAKWGYSVAVPADIHECCIMQAARWFKRLEGSMSDALASGELGMLLYRQSLDPDVKMILVSGRRMRPMVGRV